MTCFACQKRLNLCPIPTLHATKNTNTTKLVESYINYMRLAFSAHNRKKQKKNAQFSAQKVVVEGSFFDTTPKVGFTAIKAQWGWAVPTNNGLGDVFMGRNKDSARG